VVIGCSSLRSPLKKVKRKATTPTQIETSVSFEDIFKSRARTRATDITVNNEISPKTPLRKFPKNKEAVSANIRTMTLEIRTLFVSIWSFSEFFSTKNPISTNLGSDGKN